MGRTVSRKWFSQLGINRLEERAMPSASPSAVIRWNEVVNQANAIDHSGSPEQGGPTKTARAYAIVHTAIFDAVNSILKQYEPYKVSLPAPRTASIPAAIATAAHDTLVSLYPSQQALFDTTLAQELAAIPDGISENQGITVGQQVAAQILAIRATDGVSDPEPPYVPPVGPGFWSSDPLHPGQQALNPFIGSATPFTLNTGQQFRIPAPPALNSAAYTAAYNEILAFGGDGVNSPTIRNQEQTEIGIYWGYDGQPGLGTPPRLYNQITRVIAEQKGNTEIQNARLFALVNMAQTDAGIACWESKYVFNFWRPVTAVRDGANDGNANTAGDPNWSPLGAPAVSPNTNFTPPFPAYASGHATFGAATFRTIANFYGTDNIPFTFVSDELNGVTIGQDGNPRPLRPRSFQTLSQATEENGQSRIYLGIHWSFDKVEGIKQGSAIADWAFDNFLRAKSNTKRLITGADAGGGSHVKVFNDGTGELLKSFFAFDAGFRGGVRVAGADVNGDGTPDIITGAGPGGGSHVKVFDGANHNLLHSFFAYPGFAGGLYVAGGDVNNDGFADIITGADAGGGPHVKAFSGADGSLIKSFFAYGAGFLGGVRVATGDVDGDGSDDIVTGAGAGGGPHVLAFSGASNAILQSFFAYSPAFLGGVFVSAGDCDGDGKADIVTGAGAGGGPQVLVFNGNGQILQSFFAFSPSGSQTTNGVRVGCADIDGDGRADLVTGAGRGDAPVTECRDAANLTQLERNFAYDPSFLGGVYVGSVN